MKMDGCKITFLLEMAYFQVGVSLQEGYLLLVYPSCGGSMMKSSATSQGGPGYGLLRWLSSWGSEIYSPDNKQCNIFMM